MDSQEDFKREISDKERFEFGENWKIFLTKINESRIKEAEISFKAMLKLENLEGKSFLDIGSGSGLSSLVAKNLGAAVCSFDFDDSSVWCTKELKSRYYPDDLNWEVKQGSALNTKFLDSLGKFDIVYSWGVLHHTGEMWLAIENSLNLVKESGLFFIAIYNDQGLLSRFWWIIKFFYTKLPTFLKKPYAFSIDFIVRLLSLRKYTLKLKPMAFLEPMFNYKRSRGMSVASDIVDWYGGFPYEFAKYNYLIKFIESKGYILINGREAESLGCHELIFKKIKS